jgi:heme-degrading monooxygenase HmoA
MSAFHLAQINTARLRAPLDDPSMAEFVAGLVLMNALADRSPGFVWRLEGEQGDGTIAAVDDPHRIYTMSVWESPEDLRAYAYQSEHLDYLRRRREWFHPHGHQAALVLWWVPVGTVPTLRNGISRLGRLQAEGAGPEGFTFREMFAAPVMSRP